MREHGSRARYVWGPEGQSPENGCRCFECSDATYRYERDRRRLREAGVPAYVDATEARDHLRWLRSNGIGKRTVAARTGLSLSAVEKVVNGKVSRIRPTTADRILAVHLGHTPAMAVVDAGPTLRLIEELVAHGHTKGSIALALGAQTRALQIGRSGKVTAATAEKVRRLHSEWLRPVLVRREQDAERRAHYRKLERERAVS